MYLLTVFQGCISNHLPYLMCVRFTGTGVRHYPSFYRVGNRDVLFDHTAYMVAVKSFPDRAFSSNGSRASLYFASRTNLEDARIFLMNFSFLAATSD